MALEGSYAAGASLATRGVVASMQTEAEVHSKRPSFSTQVLSAPASAMCQRTRPLELACAAGIHNRAWVTTAPVPNQPFLTKRIFGDHLFVHDPITAFFGDGQPIPKK
mmetsp:Transcript_82388/g.191340  ORF Transcript_82388/g.191340 Transcript_82388/m.191340 type:complete len:108 (-) Transcript_82388:60-383(-)|eukprot:CAMPEP_0171105444 /NCGR_PEP_ID=MMETSP0766_2-20121228/62702_1 /TAXON_ID=439317 /ORGANISM="Gambierdiscus australes, Strain CAWD 149" /LENGTH=107 /DNA_ID=CAMNT_0011566299 /DNA_START=53 /DNA_END=376 /DNA_ORIENTATION=+